MKAACEFNRTAKTNGVIVGIGVGIGAGERKTHQHGQLNLSLLARPIEEIGDGNIVLNGQGLAGGLELAEVQVRNFAIQSLAGGAVFHHVFPLVARDTAQQRAHHDLGVTAQFQTNVRIELA